MAFTSVLSREGHRLRTKENGIPPRAKFTGTENGLHCFFSCVVVPVRRGFVAENWGLPAADPTFSAENMTTSNCALQEARCGTQCTCVGAFAILWKVLRTGCNR